MKNINGNKMKMLLAASLVLLASSCLKDKDFEDRKFQSLDNHGTDQNMVSTAVTTSSNSQFLLSAYDASTTTAVINLIPVVYSSAKPAPQDLHVTFVPAPDSLAAYNSRTFDDFDETGKIVVQAHPEDYYVLAGTPGSPAFTLLNNGVATIKAGEQVGYLQISTATADYFQDTQYAFPYKIQSVQEGTPVSGNNNFGIVVIVPKNQYDANYATIGYFGHPSAPRAINQTFHISTFNINTITVPIGDLTPASDYNMQLQVNDDNTLTFVSATVAGTRLLTAADEASAAYPGNTSAHPWSYYDNQYHPDTKSFRLRYGYKTSAWRTITAEMVRVKE